LATVTVVILQTCYSGDMLLVRYARMLISKQLGSLSLFTSFQTAANSLAVVFATGSACVHALLCMCVSVQVFLLCYE
jgi:hypothetical protein